MLSWRLATLLAACLATMSSLATPAEAAGPSGVGVRCDPVTRVCQVSVWRGGSTGDGPGLGGPGTTSVAQSSCRSPTGAPVACYTPTAGWYSQALHCYFLLRSPWPAPDDPLLGGTGSYHQPGDGAYYLTHCWGGPPTRPNVGYAWRAATPPGYGWQVSPDVLAARAVKMLELRGPVISLSPPLSKRQIVGLPMWAWTAVTPSTWGTHSATATVGGQSVTATAVSKSISWSWGDGTSTTCTGPGTPWTPAHDGNAASPTCGHTYVHDSYGGEFPVTARTTWDISWVGGGLASGAHGQLTVVAPARTRVHVSELQAVNVPNPR